MLIAQKIGSSSVSVGSTRSQDGRWLECFLPRTSLITRADSNYSGGHEKREGVSQCRRNRIKPKIPEGH